MSRTKVAIFGSSGQLGTDLVDVFGQSGSFEVIPLTHEDADCTDASAVRKILLSSRPQIVINSAAFVRVDDCEDHPEQAFRVNAVGAFHIAKTCAEIDALCVYISTDYVFDGGKTSAYTEGDVPAPINVYGASKLAGEQLVRQSARRWLILRTASLFGQRGARGKGGNFVETIVAKGQAGQPLRIVDDTRMSPAYAYDVARAAAEIIRKDVTGILHVTNQGSCSWYEFATAILAEAGLETDIKPVNSNEFRTKAVRPKNSALATDRLDGLLEKPLSPWRSALRDYLARKGHGSWAHQARFG